MDELLARLGLREVGDASMVGAREVLVAFAVSAALSLVITRVYRSTHAGPSFPQTFTVALVLMSVGVGFVMMVVGSSLARAFTLVGALSIIRYRTAVKDTRDTAFLFLAMVVGMACGVQLYLHAAVFTAATSVLLLVLDRSRIGGPGRPEQLVEVAFPLATEGAPDVHAILRRSGARRVSLVSSEAIGARRVLVYAVELGRGATDTDLAAVIARKVPGVDVRVITGTAPVDG